MLQSHGDLGQGQEVCWPGQRCHILMVVTKFTEEIAENKGCFISSIIKIIIIYSNFQSNIKGRVHPQIKMATYLVMNFIVYFSSLCFIYFHLLSRFSNVPRMTSEYLKVEASTLHNLMPQKLIIPWSKAQTSPSIRKIGEYKCIQNNKQQLIGHYCVKGWIFLQILNKLQVKMSPAR